MARKKTANQSSRKSKLLKTQKEVAEHFNVSGTAVGRWCKQGMPGSRGNYDPAAIEKWRQSKENKPRDGFLYSLKDVAEFFEVSSTTIDDWRKKGMPGKTGKYDPVAINQWREKTLFRKPEYDYENFDQDPPEDAEEIRKLKIRKLRAAVVREEQMAKREMRLNQLEEESYLKKEDVHTFISGFLQEQRNTLMRIPIDGKAGYGNRADFHEKDLTARLKQHLKHMHHWILKLKKMEHKPE